MKINEKNMDGVWCDCDDVAVRRHDDRVFCSTVNKGERVKE